MDRNYVRWELARCWELFAGTSARQAGYAYHLRRPLHTDDLEAPMPDDSMSLDDLQSFWTVVGVWPETKERYAEHVAAQSARQAEDLAQMTAREKGGVLWVCAVYEGKLISADTYAQFVDPDMTTQAEF